MMYEASEDQPFDESTAIIQHDALLEVLGPAPKRVLDLGCGTGRLLIPLVQAGHIVIGVDQRVDALAECKRALDEARMSALLMQCDFLELDRADMTSAFDAVLCLGNTFMTITDVDDAVNLMSGIRELLKPDGVFILDDLPFEHWPELTEGYWQGGTSEDGNAQIVWHETDALFALRREGEVMPEIDTLQDNDQRYRLWTDGSLRLVTRLAGLSVPHRHDSQTLLIMQSHA